jgi:hypothetical protein
MLRKTGCPYLFTALIVRAIQVMGKCMEPLLGGVSDHHAESEDLFQTKTCNRLFIRQVSAKGDPVGVAFL